MGRKPRCPICRSKRWHRDALSGSVVCEDGHLLQGYVQESNESQEASQFVTTTRRIRKNKARKLKAPTNDHLHGDRARFLLAQALQLVLRHQLKVLVDTLGFPPDLESVCKDLWAILLASSGLPAAPADHERGDEPASSYSGPREGARYHRVGRKRKKGANGDGGDGGDGDDEEDERVRAKRGGERGSDDSDDEDDDDDDDDEERGPLEPDELPKVSPPLGAPNPYEPPSRAPTSKQHPPTDVRERLRVDYLLVILYLGCVTLRLPVLLQDILDLAATYRIPYLNARLSLPLEMQLHLNLASAHSLNPSLVPRVAGLQSTLARIVRLYRDDWHVHFPEPNLPVLSWRLCRSLALPPLFYVALKSLLSLLPPLSFSPPTHRTRTEPRVPPRPPFVPLSPAEEALSWPAPDQLPESIIAAALVVLLRLVSDCKTDLAKEIRRLLPDSVAWADALEKIEELKPGGETRRIFNQPVASLEMDDVDAYLSFFESTIAPAFPDQKRMAEIERHFPPPRSLPSAFPRAPASLSTEIDDLLSTLYTTPSSSKTCSPPTLIHHAASLIGLSSAELSPLVGTIESILVKREYAIDGGKERKRAAWEDRKEQSTVAREDRWNKEQARREKLHRLRDEGREVVSEPED